jgi:hypothetical protein
MDFSFYFLIATFKLSYISLVFPSSFTFIAVIFFFLIFLLWGSVFCLLALRVSVVHQTLDLSRLPGEVLTSPDIALRNQHLIDSHSRYHVDSAICCCREHFPFPRASICECTAIRRKADRLPSPG